VKLHFHTQSEPGAMFQQPSMEVQVANQMVMTRGPSFGVHEANPLTWGCRERMGSDGSAKIYRCGI
jgi:hypothetical protein